MVVDLGSAPSQDLRQHGSFQGGGVISSPAPGHPTAGTPATHLTLRPRGFPLGSECAPQHGWAAVTTCLDVGAVGGRGGPPGRCRFSVAVGKFQEVTRGCWSEDTGLCRSERLWSSWVQGSCACVVGGEEGRGRRVCFGEWGPVLGVSHAWARGGAFPPWWAARRF